MIIVPTLSLKSFSLSDYWPYSVYSQCAADAALQKLRDQLERSAQ